MSTLMTRAGRGSPRNSAIRGPRKRPKTFRTQPRSIRQSIDPSQTPGMAPLLPNHHRGVFIQGAFRPNITDHFFKIRLDSDTILRLAFATSNCVAGLQVVRLPDGQSSGSIAPADVLATASTLVTNPATSDLALGIGSYLIQIYNFFNDADEYFLELSSRPASRALVVLDGHQPAGHSAAPALVQR